MRPLAECRSGGVGSVNREARLPVMATDDSTLGIAAEWWEELREFRTTPAQTRQRRRGRLGVHRQRRRRGGPPDTVWRGRWSGRSFLPGLRGPLPGSRAELRRCYPRAGVYTFRGAGHTPWMSRREEHLSVSKEFLDQEEGTRT